MEEFYIFNFDLRGDLHRLKIDFLLTLNLKHYIDFKFIIITKYILFFN